MGQIVKRKKKGRPSKADLAERRATGNKNSPATESDVRRSLRRRNAKHSSIIDYDDYLDFYEDVEEEEERRGEEEDDDDDDDDSRRTRTTTKKQKKLKLVGKLPPDEDDDRVVTESSRPGSDVDNQDEDYNNNHHNHNYDEERGTKANSKGQDSGPGTPSDPRSVYPLPEKKSLELILDKLQKKDIYGVYAEPVDPEELPDYHDIIKHPMDFATIRNKLGNGVYSTLEQLESDVFLICSNAMQYNAPDTVYYKQARTIQELARRKFQKVRLNIERSEKELKSEQRTRSNELKSEQRTRSNELKSEQRTRSNSLPKQQIKKSICRTSQEPVGSDFSSGATLAAAGDIQNVSFNRPTNVDGPVGGNSSVIDSIAEKVEELVSGKGPLSKFGKKAFVQDENLRTTYNISNFPAVRSESIFSTFESEQKQLVPVGLHAEHAYARSLARFAASLGPVAWKVASKRIEQALPASFKYGRGWVGEYEPLPTPILRLETPRPSVPAFITNLQHPANVGNDDRNCNTPVSAKENPSPGPYLKGKQSSFSSNSLPNEGNPSLFRSAERRSISPASNVYRQQNPFSRNHSAAEGRIPRSVELNFSPSTNPRKQNLHVEKQVTNRSEAVSSGFTGNMNPVQSIPFKQPDSNGDVSSRLSNGKVMNNSFDGSKLFGSAGVSSPMASAMTYFPHGHEQGRSDPLQSMKKSAENMQNQQTSPRHSPVDSSQAKRPAPSSTTDDPNNAAQAAARAWMSIGAGGFSKHTAENSCPRRHHISADSLYNPARELHPQLSRFHGENSVSGGLHFQAEKNSFPGQPLAPQQFSMNEAQVLSRPGVSPRLATADLSRFQMQSPWRNYSVDPQSRQKQETLPPDLNIGFQSSGSEARQSSGVIIDSQQPDLALQL